MKSLKYIFTGIATFVIVLLAASRNDADATNKYQLRARMTPLAASSNVVQNPSPVGFTRLNTLTMGDVDDVQRKLQDFDPTATLPHLGLEDLTAAMDSRPDPAHHKGDSYNIKHAKCLDILRLADLKTGNHFGFVDHYGPLICGTARPTPAPSVSPTKMPTASPLFIVPISAKVTVVLQDGSKSRVLLEGAERTLQVNDECSAALEQTFKDLLVLPTTDTTDVDIISITQDEATGETIVVLAASVNAGCQSSSCVSTAVEEVSVAIEDSFSSGEFEDKLDTNLVGLDCPELAGLTYQSVDSTVCAEPNECSGLDDFTSCGAGEACLVTPDATCPVFSCQQTPNPTGTPTASPTVNPSASPTYPCFASDDGGYREDPNRRRHLQPKDPVPSSELSHRALEEDWKNWTCNPQGQNQTCALFDAVRDYYLQGCDSNSTCEIGQVRGHPIGSWCVGSVVNMEKLFSPRYPPLPDNITSDLSGWDTSSAETMRSMLYGQKLFNGDLPWDVSQVKDMYTMFSGADSFNSSSISNWKPSSVTTMKLMFYSADSFNQDLFWDTSSVTTMEEMFRRASSFNSDLSLLDVSQVKNMQEMFQEASSFNGNLSLWDTSSVTTMEKMFDEASSFNSSSISNWNVSQVKDMEKMFYRASSFNQDLFWDTSSVTEMDYMFEEASSFNGNLSLWDVSQVKDMRDMFYRASSFNSDSISTWKPSSVTAMQRMFREASSFNQDLFWDTSSVTYTYQMFQGASSFNSSSISNWNVSLVTNMFRMFGDATDFAQNLCLWKDAPAVQTGSSSLNKGTYQMFTGSSGQPNDGSGGFNASAC